MARNTSRSIFVNLPVSDLGRSRKFFSELCNSRTHTEGIFALSCSSRAEVDELVKKALAGGGKPAMDAVDHGFMYSWSFYDVDDHHWEVLWMDHSSTNISNPP